MRRSRRILAACVLLMAPLPASLEVIDVAAAGGPAAAALGYLRSQQSPADGSIPSSPGSYASSELFAISLAAAGSDPGAAHAGGGPSVIAYLAAHARAACASPGPCGELVQAVVAARRNPRSFGGVDLIAQLMHGYSAATGAFGDGEAFTQSLAMQGLAAARAHVPAAATSYAVSAQDSDGGWDYLDRANDKNPKDFATSDTNSTAMSLMALDATGTHTRDARAIAWLRTQQNADGGFPYQAGSGSDPDSTALVVQAIVAAGQSPTAASWTKDGRTPLQELTATQDADGGFTFPGKKAPDPFTTAQVPPALLLRPFPAVLAALPGRPASPAPGFPTGLVLIIAAAVVVVAAGGGALLRRR